ncbi:hypothetical protein IGB42_03801 [Andreprevotia sp. IGB-42]|uniref:hypothetical protein n=1 Tax=Andreprevotia sp. IGB-42 TaxID=2497473 RepID=UPI00135A9205|nr:hypothetical protein [Andreprevotia sp. IGB-42]KAF0811784.1 hypothetical protein IGB42_03801 [Andreprevotia sp. IGB-42]
MKINTGVLNTHGHIAITALLGVLLAGPALAARPVLSADGYGPVHFGDRLTTAEKRVGQRASPRPLKAECAYVKFKRYPGVNFMLQHGVIVRADAPQGVANSAGVKLHDSLASVQRNWPQVQLQPHKYEPDGHYLLLAGKDDKTALVFEEVAGKVTRMRAGLQPMVSWVEGCS